MRHSLASVAIFLCISGVCRAAEAPPDDFNSPQWVRVMNDDGAADAQWAMISSPSTPARKALT